MGVFVDHRRNLDGLAVDGGSDWKSIADNTFVASASTGGIDDTRVASSRVVYESDLISGTGVS